jgi:deoxyadenosine/deoxycytidine kinase
VEEIILKIVCAIEALKEGTICFAYLDKSYEKYEFWAICVNDFQLYMSDKRFDKIGSAWRKILKTKGCRVSFCYQNPSEKFLAKLADEDNLIMNV